MRMRMFVVGVMLVMVSIVVVGACEYEQYLDGYKWSFHRMNDGNKYHEVKKLGEFTEGNTLNLALPCQGRHIDAIQVDWEDNRSEVYGELVIMPGNQRMGVRDISGKQRQSWTVQRKANRFRIEFSGKRGHRCRVRFIRVFYGKNSQPGIQQQGGNQGAKRHKLVDRIILSNGGVKRKARVIKWDGSRMHVAIKQGQGQVLRQLAPHEIQNLSMADRWGNAVAKDGSRFPVRIKSMRGKMMDYEKNLSGRIVPKPLTDIHNFTLIQFN